MPVDDHLLAELVAIKYKFTSSGKLQIESKAEMSKRGLASPDRADAVCLTFAVEAATVIHGGGMASNWNKPIRRNLAMV
jgi:hypothetical protein